MLGFTYEHFEGLTAEDFAAFEPRKWSSNRFNLERMRTRARMESLGRGVTSRLGDQAAGLVTRTTTDHPHIFNRNQVMYCWVYLDRPEGVRTEMLRLLDKDLSIRQKVDSPVPEQQVAVVGIGLDQQRAAVFLRIHSQALLDRRNLVARLADPMEQQQFLGLLGRLPPEVQFRLGDEEWPRPSSPEDLAALRSRLETDGGWFSIERCYDASDPMLATPAFEVAATQLLEPLLAVWHFAAWSRQNDRLKIARVIKEEKKEKARRLSGFEPGDKVLVTGGLLAGKQGTVTQVDLKGRVKVQLGRIAIEMESKLLRKA